MPRETTTDTPLPATLPRFVDRKAGAKLITALLYPVSRRTLETWALPTVHANGRAVVETTVLLEAAAKRLGAPMLRGRRLRSGVAKPRAVDAA